MKYYLCELETDDGVLRIALDSESSIGISEKFVPAQTKKDLLGYSQHGATLYPIVTHASTNNPVLKFFVVYRGFAFGVTRVVDQVDVEPLPISARFPSGDSEKVSALSRYSGVVKHDDGETYFVYNLSAVEIPRGAQLIAAEDIGFAPKRDANQSYFIVLGGRYAVSKERVKTILPATLVTPFKVDDFDGFVDHGKILPVKNLDNGNYVVVMENIAYRTSRVFYVSGRVLREGLGGTNVKEFLETPEGIYEIID